MLSGSRCPGAPSNNWCNEVVSLAAGGFRSIDELRVLRGAKVFSPSICMRLHLPNSIDVVYAGAIMPIGGLRLRLRIA